MGTLFDYGLVAGVIVTTITLGCSFLVIGGYL
jgi:hypothetical protein